jgi:hypothetical protein
MVKGCYGFVKFKTGRFSARDSRIITDGQRLLAGRSAGRPVPQGIVASDQGGDGTWTVGQGGQPPELHAGPAVADSNG